MKEKIQFLKKIATFRKIKNLAQAWSAYGLSLLLKKPLTWGYPPVVMIEPTNICNLRCPLCPSGSGQLTRPKGFMDFSLFCKIIDEIKSYTSMIILWNQGEPFLHPEILNMISYAHKNGLFVLCSTNANQLPPAQNIAASGLDSLIVSLDGATQETYNTYRINGNLAKVIDNLKAITHAKKKFPLVQLQFIVMKHNEHEIEQIRKIAREVQADKLAFKTVQIYTKEDINFLPDNPKFRRYKVIGNNFELKFGLKNRCKRLWTQPVINWDGEMAVCCFDKDNKIKIGNIKDSAFKELWHSQKLHNFRKIILTNRKSIDFCQNCGEGVKLKSYFSLEKKNERI